MPTVLRVRPCRFFFYAGDRGEPTHVHIESGDTVAQFCLSPVRLEGSGGLHRQGIARLQRLDVAHADELQEAWNDYFKD